MNQSFGPWSTAINTGAPVQLDTFWKRRLAMLPSLRQSTSGTARRTVFLLFAIAVAALAFPTLKWATHAQSAGSVVVLTNGALQSAGTAAAEAVDRREKAGAESQDQVDVPDVEYLPRPSKFEEQVLAALEKPVDIEFSKLALADCIDYLRKESKIPMWIAEQSLTDEGIALDQPVTLQLKATRLESVLNLLLHPAQLEYVPENEVLMITTMTKAGENVITRTYPVRDLVLVPKLPDDDSPDDKSTGTRPEVPANTGGEKGPTPSDPNSTETKPSTGAASRVLKQGFGGMGMGGGGMGGGGRGGGGMGGGGRFARPRAVLPGVACRQRRTSRPPRQWLPAEGCARGRSCPPTRGERRRANRRRTGA